MKSTKSISRRKTRILVADDHPLFREGLVQLINREHDLCCCGETDTVEKMKARIDYDLAYLRSWSVLLDLQIVLKTVVVVLRKQNAY